jgi:hypothetical protein
MIEPIVVKRVSEPEETFWRTQLFKDGDDTAKLRRMAEALVAEFGDGALAIAERQVALAENQPDVARVWRQIALLLRATY